MADRDRTARLRPRTGLSRAVCHWRPVEDSRNLGDGRSSAGGAEDTALPTVLAVALAIFSFPLNVKPVLCNRRPGEIGRPRSSALARSGPLDLRAQVQIRSVLRSDTQSDTPTRLACSCRPVATDLAAQLGSYGRLRRLRPTTVAAPNSRLARRPAEVAATMAGCRCNSRLEL